jgi:YVTN family beta-propeller protein
MSKRLPLFTVFLTGMSLIGVGILTGCATMNQFMAPPTKPAGLNTRVYTANESSNTVTVLDGDNFSVIGNIDTLNYGTHDLALSRDGKQLWATNLANGRVSVIDTDSLQTIASIYTGKQAHGVALTNNNKHAWVANIADNTISIIDTSIYRILGTIPVGKGPMGIAFSRDGKLAYVSSQDKMVNVIDTTAHQVIKQIPVGPNPHFLTLGPDGNIWGTNTGSKDIYVIDTTTNEIAGTIEVGPAPQQIAFALKGTAGPNAYVTVTGLNKIVVVDATAPTLSIREHIDVGEGPNGIWANAVGTRIYVGHSMSNNLLVVDTGTSQVLATLPVGRKPIRVVASR